MTVLELRQLLYAIDAGIARLLVMMSLNIVLTLGIFLWEKWSAKD